MKNKWKKYDKTKKVVKNMPCPLDVLHERLNKISNEDLLTEEQLLERELTDERLKEWRQQINT